MMLILTRSVSMSLMMGYIFTILVAMANNYAFNIMDVGKRDMGERTPPTIHCWGT